MKLYTEEQVIKMIEKSRETGLTAEYLILTTISIELPTDEEIENLIGDGMHNYYKGGFEEGALWMRNKIQGGNNE